jgi:hypothetical protein
MTPRLLTPALCLVAACSLAGPTARAQSPAPNGSPFAPPASANPGEAPAERIEFAGVMIGETTDLIFKDKTTGKKTFVGVGKTADGITVQKYDPRLDQVVVKINGEQKTLTLKKASGPANAPAPVAAMPVGFNTPTPATVQTISQPAAATAPQPVAGAGTTPPVAASGTPTQPAPPATPETQQKAETEARMLVSDLLEIGMAQRKAYEDAQKKAQEGGAPATTPTPAAPVAAAPATPPATPPPGGN